MSKTVDDRPPPGARGDEDTAGAAVAAAEPPESGSSREAYFEVDRETSRAFDRIWSAPAGLLGRLATVNNIPIAQRYMIAAFAFFLLGGAMALLMRWQLAVPGNDFLDAETYNQLFTRHGTTMMFLFVIPFIEAVANYMLPMLLGTRDLPFPQLTALSYWTYFFGGIFLYSSFLFGVAPNGGWFAYVPLTNVQYSPGINMDWWDIGLSVAEIAAMGAAAELIVAILRMRAAGMTLARMPVFAWSMLVAAFMIRGGAASVRSKSTRGGGGADCTSKSSAAITPAALRPGSWRRSAAGQSRDRSRSCPRPGHGVPCG